MLEHPNIQTPQLFCTEEYRYIVYIYTYTYIYIYIYIYINIYTHARLTSDFPDITTLRLDRLQVPSSRIGFVR